MRPGPGSLLSAAIARAHRQHASSLLLTHLQSAPPLAHVCRYRSLSTSRVRRADVPRVTTDTSLEAPDASLLVQDEIAPKKRLVSLEEGMFKWRYGEDSEYEYPYLRLGPHMSKYEEELMDQPASGATAVMAEVAPSPFFYVFIPTLNYFSTLEEFKSVATGLVEKGHECVLVDFPGFHLDPDFNTAVVEEDLLATLGDGYVGNKAKIRQRMRKKSSSSSRVEEGAKAAATEKRERGAGEAAEGGGGGGGGGGSSYTSMDDRVIRSCTEANHIYLHFLRQFIEHIFTDGMSRHLYSKVVLVGAGLSAVYIMRCLEMILLPPSVPAFTPLIDPPLPPPSDELREIIQRKLHLVTLICPSWLHLWDYRKVYSVPRGRIGWICASIKRAIGWRGKPVKMELTLDKYRLYRSLLTGDGHYKIPGEERFRNKFFGTDKFILREYGSLVLRNTNPDTIDAEMEKERGFKNTNHVQSMMELKEAMMEEKKTPKYLYAALSGGLLDACRSLQEFTNLFRRLCLPADLTAMSDETTPSHGSLKPPLGVNTFVIFGQSPAWGWGTSQFWLSFTPLKDMLVEAQRQRAKVTGERPDDVMLPLQLSFNRGRVLLQEEFSMDIIDTLDRAAQGKLIKKDTEI